MATGQVLTDLAQELAKRGHQVTVIAADRGYDNPSKRFSRREIWQDVAIIRIPSLGLGKNAKWRRALNFGSFLVNCALRLSFMPRFDVVVGLTSPPLISLLGSLFVQLKGGRFCFWVMDLNPDEAIAAGWLKERSFAAKMLSWLLRYSLHHAHRVIVLDRFMKQRIVAKRIPEEKVTVLPPWAHDDSIHYDEKGRRAFRERHNLSDRFVVMYSGNHSPCHPLDTLLEAARRLESRNEIGFCFVGGGSEQAKVEAFKTSHGLSNVTCLPYQPLGELSGSLSAADLHTVVMGNEFAGIVHPCKVYNILSIGSPFLYIGPEQSHVTEIATQDANNCLVYAARHGEADRVVRHILEALKVRSPRPVGSSSELAGEFAKSVLLPRMIELLEALNDKPETREPETVNRRLENHAMTTDH